MTVLSEACKKCPYVDTCGHKMMAAVARLSPAAESAAQEAAQELMVKHDYRDIKIDQDTTVTIDLEDIKKQIEKRIYESFLNPSNFGA